VLGKVLMVHGLETIWTGKYEKLSRQWYYGCYLL